MTEQNCWTTAKNYRTADPRIAQPNGWTKQKDILFLISVNKLRQEDDIKFWTNATTKQRQEDDIKFWTNATTKQRQEDHKIVNKPTTKQRQAYDKTNQQSERISIDPDQLQNLWFERVARVLYTWKVKFL
jgi:protein tyrosine/serine phosphatase